MGLTTLLHQTTVSLTQPQRLAQTAADILQDLHSVYLVHTHQVDPRFQQPPPPTSPPIGPMLLGGLVSPSNNAKQDGQNSRNKTFNTPPSPLHHLLLLHPCASRSSSSQPHTLVLSCLLFMSSSFCLFLRAHTRISLNLCFHCGLPSRKACV